MTEIRYNKKIYGSISNNSRDIIFDDTNIKAIATQSGLDGSSLNISNIQEAIDTCYLGLSAFSVYVKEITVNNIAVTSKSNAGAFYGTAISYEDLGIPYGRIASVTLLNWSGASASFNLYLHHSDGIRVISDISQTISTIPIRIIYFNGIV